MTTTVSPLVLQWTIAGILVACGLWFGIYYLRAIGEGISKETASSDKRRAMHAALVAESPTLSTFDTSELLLDAAVDLYERKHAAIATLDDKAQKLVALIGGGASLFALLGGFSGALHATLTPLLVLSIVCFFVALVLLLLSLRPVETDLVAITEFNSPPVLADPSFRAKVARRLIEAWQEITLGLNPILRKKGRYIFVSMVLIVVGASVLLTNFLFLVEQNANSTPSTTANPKPFKLSCSGKLDHVLHNLSMTCEETVK